MCRKAFKSILLVVSPLAFSFILILVLFVLTASAKREHTSTQIRLWPSGEKQSIKSQELLNSDGLLYLPLIFDTLPWDVELLDAWTSGASGEEKIAHHVQEEMQYWVSGINRLTIPVTVSIRWTQEDQCQDDGYFQQNTLYSQTHVLEPGEWQISFPTLSPACSGLYAPQVQLKHNTVIQDRYTEFAVNQYSSVIVNGGQGFDKCGLPEIWKMETWWQNSPYEVFNLYLGGISFACKNIPLDAVWVRKTAEQGWKFIQTWVGPQAPCTTYTHRMSLDTSTAYQQGVHEAQAAAEASYELGLFSDKIIYYDVEAYGQDDSACHKSVRSFLRGWTTRLHELGYKSGAYGAGCTSYMTEWASLSPPPDDVWIANYYTNYYDPNATVWDAPCISNSLWKNHQRIKQYTGGHNETWGGVSIIMDSNVLDGEITTLDLENTQKQFSVGSTRLETYGLPVEGLGLISLSQGWVLSSGRLLISDDNGQSWVNISPQQVQVLGASFVDSVNGWIAGQGSSGGLSMYKTEDGGVNWVATPLPLRTAEVANITSASIDPIDSDSIWVALKLQTGSNFSAGRLFFSGNGGISWQERKSPTGGVVNFLDIERGWMMGGPGGDELFLTQDGGRTWQPETSDKYSLSQTEPIPFVFQAAQAGTSFPFTHFQRNFPEGLVAIDFIDPLHAWAATQTGACEGKKGVPGAILSCVQHWRLLSTVDGGLTWQEIFLE